MLKTEEPDRNLWIRVGCGYLSGYLLFISLLHKLNKAYREAKRIILIVDN